jgi:acetyl-CoA carboxylase carboxyl transferase subunit alpha
MSTVPKGPYLDFELPVAELAHKIEDLMRSEDVTSEDVQKLILKKEKLQKKIHKELTPWDRVELARRAGRPYTLDIVENLFTDFVEIKGDRCFGDDPALVAGFAKLQGKSVAVLGHQKGRDTKESIQRNFGMAHPEGYRKALRVFKLAEKFKMPVICFIDTPGAYPGLGGEERGQAQAIAENLKVMSTLEVPVLCVVIGEGASGGALGIGVGDRLFMFENSWYSVITPEGCAAILWGENAKKKEVSSVMKLTATDLKDLGVVDKVIPEPLGGAHWDVEALYETLGPILVDALEDLSKLSPMDLVEQRVSKYSQIGVNEEA